MVTGWGRIDGHGVFGGRGEGGGGGVVECIEITEYDVNAMFQLPLMHVFVLYPCSIYTFSLRSHPVT